MHVAWLSIREGENEPGRLLVHVIRALSKVSKQIIANLPAIVEAWRTLPVELILTRMFTGVMARKLQLLLAMDHAPFVGSHFESRALSTVTCRVALLALAFATPRRDAPDLETPYAKPLSHSHGRCLSLFRSGSRFGFGTDRSQDADLHRIHLDVRCGHDGGCR
jgi:hypothetical protein